MCETQQAYVHCRQTAVHVQQLGMLVLWVHVVLWLVMVLHVAFGPTRGADKGMGQLL